MRSITQDLEEISAQTGSGVLEFAEMVAVILYQDDYSATRLCDSDGTRGCQDLPATVYDA